MGTDAKKILDRLAKAKGDRKKVSLYLSESLLKAFRDDCDDAGASASEVMEELMREFCESLKSKKR